MDTTHASLLLRIKSPGDSAAWQEFDQLYRPMLFRFAVARGLSHADAEDVVQHCMAATAKHIAGFDYDPSRGRFRGWLRTLVNNRVRTMLRGPHDQQADTHVLNRAEPQEESPDETFDRLWRQEHLQHCLARVRSEVEEASFKAFAALVMDERPVEDVCKELSMNPNQVYLIKWRLTNKLRQHMKALLGDTE